MRVKWVDYAKAGSILLVVMGHAGFPESVRSVIYVFHIPLFFFLSGLFFSFEKYPEYKTFLKNRFLQLVVPYLFFNIITYLFWLTVGRQFGKDALFDLDPLKPLLGILYGNATGHFLEHNVPLWFLACLFITENLYFLVFRKLNRKFQFFVLILAALVGYFDYKYNHSLRFPWGMNIAVVMLVFYGTGSLLRFWFLAEAKSKLILFSETVISAVVVLLVAQWNGKIEVSAHEYGHYLYFLVGAFAGILFAVSLSKLIDQAGLNLNFLQFIGKNTLIVLALHLTAGSFVKAITVYALHLPLTIFDSPGAAFVYSLASVVSLVPVIIIMNRFLPILIGKSKA